MSHQIFLSPQVKRWAIITYKHGIYKLSHELPNDLRRWGASVPTKEKKTKKLRELGDIRKLSTHHRMIAQCPVPLAK